MADYTADIKKATNAFELQQIRNLIYNDEVAQKYTAANKLAADTVEGYKGLDGAELLEYKRSVILALIPNYLKPSTTALTQTEESMGKEADADVKRLMIVYRALIASEL